MTLHLFPEDERPAPLPAWNFVRLVREPGTMTRPPVQIRGPSDVRRLLIERVQLLDQEAFYVVCLDAQSQVRAVHEASRGTLNSSLVHPREVFRTAILAGAAGIILVHNHPSGETPHTQRGRRSGVRGDPGLPDGGRAGARQSGRSTVQRVDSSPDLFGP